MKIYSIKEIVNASKKILDHDTELLNKKNTFNIQYQIPFETEKII